MSLYAAIAPDGRIVEVLTILGPEDAGPDGAELVACGPGVRPETHHATGAPGEWQIVARPETAGPVSPQAVPFQIVPLPGQSVRVVNEAGARAVTDDPADPVTVTGPGTLRVRITGAWPARDWRGTVEAVDA